MDPLCDHLLDIERLTAGKEQRPLPLYSTIFPDNTTMPLTVNAHPESQARQGTHSTIHHPPEDHTHHDTSGDSKPIPDTGWRGEPATPSSDGGDSEKDWFNKPPYRWTPACGPDGKELFVTKYESECWCGAVKFAFAGDPLDAKHCHCRQCQRLHGAPFQWAVIFPKTSVRLIRNEANALHCFSTDTKDARHHVPCKVSCDTCRAPIFDEGRRAVLAYPSGFRFQAVKARVSRGEGEGEDEKAAETGEGHHDPQHADLHPPGHYGSVPQEFQPSCHIFYGQRVIEINDGIPKWRGHKNDSELMQEMSDVEGIMPRYKGHVDHPSADGG
ncbi:hypothetical protein HYDPIDRAFT_109048 [Hydnomerulius pinastri MD-312]|nr:hypothetical protein HYDPIDRAFT_109048 [Hydnomerulius pinastri MD-312]